MNERFFPAYSTQVEDFDPLQIRTDAARFQFKSDGDAKGITRQLLFVKNWEPAFSGIVFVWESLGGQLFIADGHQRLGLATRLMAKNSAAPITLRGQRFREADGWTVETMRVFAAAKNIAEGGESTKAIDVAKLLRNGGPVAFLDQHISAQRRCYREGKALAQLGDDPFHLVLNHVVPEYWGIVVGDMIAEPKEQLSALEYLKKQKPPQDEVQDLVQEIVATGFLMYSQTNLFGEVDLAHGLINERIAVYRHCRKQLKKLADGLDKGLKIADEFTICGVQINEGAVQKQRVLRETMRWLAKEARMKGTDISASLDRAALHLHKHGDMAAAASIFMQCLERGTRQYLPQTEAPLPSVAETEAPLLPVALPKVQEEGQFGMF